MEENVSVQSYDIDYLVDNLVNEFEDINIYQTPTDQILRIIKIIEHDFYHIAYHIVNYGYEKDIVDESQYYDIKTSEQIYEYLEKNNYGLFILINQIHEYAPGEPIDEEMVIYYLDQYIENLF